MSHRLELSTNAVRWATRPVTPYNYFRLHEALWPRSMFQSLQASWDTFLAQQIKRITTALEFINGQSGRPAKDGDSKANNKQTGVLNKQADVATKPDQAKPSTASSTSSAAAIASKDRSSFIASVQPLANVGNNDFLFASWVHQLITDGQAPSAAFVKTLKRTWRPVLTPPPRGSVIVSGLVEVVGPDGLVLLDVTAAYDPKESQWVGLHAQIRRAKERRQSPKG